MHEHVCFTSHLVWSVQLYICKDMQVCNQWTHHNAMERIEQVKNACTGSDARSMSISL